MDANLTPQALRILECAQTLIAVGGYNGFSYADISSQVGITKASIHHHFPKKADLVRILVQRYRTAAEEGMAALEANHPEPRKGLQAYVGWWRECIENATMPMCICAMLSAETLALPEEVAVEVRQHFVSLARWLERLMSAGVEGGAFELSTSSANESQAFMATVHGAMLSARAYGDPKLFDAIAQAAVQRLLPRTAESARPGRSR